VQGQDVACAKNDSEQCAVSIVLLQKTKKNFEKCFEHCSNCFPLSPSNKNLQNCLVFEDFQGKSMQKK